MEPDRRPLCIALTGATGYVGARLSRMAAAAGMSLVLLGRRRPALPSGVNVHFYDYALGDDVPTGALTGVDGFIHLAAAGLDDGEGQELNLKGTQTLFEACRDAGVHRFVYVSSLAARTDAPTSYGRGKWAVEELLAKTDAVIVRPGLVYGGEEGGVYGAICRLLRLSPVLPVVGAAAPVQPIHVDELCRALLDIAGADRPGRSVYALGAQRPVPFARFLRDVARARGLGRGLVLPVPTPLALVGAWIFRALPFLPNVPRERILGLADLRAADTADSLADLGLMLGDPAVLLAREGLRRRLLREGRTLLAYMLGEPPPGILSRRYVRALHVLGEDTPVDLPKLVLRWPALLRLWDPLAKDPNNMPANALGPRLNIALGIAEASPEGARRFLARRPRAATAVVVELAVIVIMEAIILPARFFLGRPRR